MGTNKTRESVFRFKQFDVANSLSAMKVGTDGVLLGAWADVESGSRCPRVLDVGTGSGLIAMMLAQRFPAAEITGIDVVEDACTEARANADASPWGGRIDIVCDDFMGYASGCQVFFDAVVSNPPFFKSALKAPDRQRMLARHGDGLDYEKIIRACASGLLASHGVLSMVSPVDREGDIIFDMEMAGMWLSRLTRVWTKPDAAAPSRLLWEMRLGKKVHPTRYHDLTIGSAAYAELTHDFYLDR